MSLNYALIPTLSPAIHHATLANAEILDIADETGSINVGKSADLVVLAENPLKRIEAVSQVDMLFVRGMLIEKPRYKKLKGMEEYNAAALKTAIAWLQEKK